MAACSLSTSVWADGWCPKIIGAGKTEHTHSCFPSLAEHFFYFQDLFARNAIDTICRDYHIESKRSWTVCKLARTMSATPLVFHVLSLEHWKHQRASCPERSLPAGLELQIRAWSRLTHAVLRLGRMNDITLLLSTCTSALPSKNSGRKGCFMCGAQLLFRLIMKFAPWQPVWIACNLPQNAARTLGLLRSSWMRLLWRSVLVNSPLSTPPQISVVHLHRRLCKA